MKSIKGRVKKIFYQKGDWSCILFITADNKETFVAKGCIGGALFEGIEILIEGEFVKDSKYGNQFQITEGTVLESTIVTFLHKCVKGIGHALAKEIVGTLGQDCIELISKDNEVLYKVKGIKEKKLKKIVESLEENKNIQKYIDVFDFFKNDITYMQADKIVKLSMRDKNCIKKMKKNPYWLIAHVEGFGFKRVDKLAMAAGIGRYSLERVAAAIVYTLKDVAKREGHCFLTMNELTFEVINFLIAKPTKLSAKEVTKLQSMLIVGDDDVDDFAKDHAYTEIIEDYIEAFDKILILMSEALVENSNENLIIIEDERIYVKELYDTECSLAKSIANMVKKKPVKIVEDSIIEATIKKIEDEEGILFAAEQKDAVIAGLKNRLSVISGGPGRGKTTILRLMIECWDDDNVILLAPTGKAAKRMEEATGRPAMTLQRYRYEIRAFDGYIADKPDGALVIFDEASMAGIELADLLFMIAEKCNLVIVGDVDQLESIEPGTFLRDIINCGYVKVTLLTQGYRNFESIAQNATLINQGKGPGTYEYDDAFHFIQTEKDHMADEVVRIYGKLLESYHPNDIGIISPVRKRGYGSVSILNAAIRDVYNPATTNNPDNASGFRIGDRVMNTSNDYERVLDHSSGKKDIGVFNGDTGNVSAIDIFSETLDVTFDDGKMTSYKFSELESLILAYAMTIHKSLGSEWKALILVMSLEYSYFVQRRAFYTGETRARFIEYLVGSKKAAALAALKTDAADRNSFLVIRIQNIF